MFFDFFCAFDTICLALLGEKLQVDALPDVSLGCELPNWYVRLENCVSDTVVSHIGAPQGTVLSPSLFTLYNFNHSRESCCHQKIANASACDGDEYRTVVGASVTWLNTNRLQLDLRKAKSLVTPVSI